MAKNFFKKPIHDRNPYCENAKFCKGLCACVLVTRKELKHNHACPHATKCKHSAGCMQTVADKACPVCAGVRTEYYYRIQDEIFTAKCICNTCNRAGLGTIPLNITPDIFLIHTPDGFGRTISTNDTEYYIYIKKFALLRKIDV